MNLYPNIFMTHGAFTFSDHCPIIISTTVEVRQCTPCPCWFQFFWTKHHEVDKLIHKNWSSAIKGTKMFKFSHKLKAKKIALSPGPNRPLVISMKKSGATWIKLIMWKKNC